MYYIKENYGKTGDERKKKRFIERRDGEGGGRGGKEREMTVVEKSR